MKLSWGARRSLAARWGGGAVGLIRPGAEAVLLAGVAIGCAQVSWRIASPDAANLSFPETTSAQAELKPPGDLRSPFAPFGASEESGESSHADVSGIRLVGVRMSSRSESSGAILVLGDGVQRSFLVGFQIAAGVRLEEVASDHIVVSVGDGHESLMLENAQQHGPSLALALLGVPQRAPDAQPVQTASWTADTTAKAVSMPVGAAANADVVPWLMSIAGQVELRAGVPYGWRAATALPEARVEAGDIVLSVNGVGPSDGQAKLVSAARGPLTFLVERRSGERLRLSLSSGISP